MLEYSLTEKLETVLTIVKSSPFFLTCFLIAVSIIALLLLDLKTTKKVKSGMLITLWIITIGYIILKYNNYLLNLSDNFIEEFINAIYFPNFAIYTLVVITTNIVFIITVLFKKIPYKIINMFITVSIDFVFILVLDTVTKNKIDIYETITMLSNKNLLILLELSTILYLLSILLNGLTFVILKTIKPLRISKQTITYEAPKINVFEKNEIKDYKDNFNIKPTEKENSYVSIFDSINDDGLMNSIVFLEKKEELELNGDKLLYLFKRGETLNREQYKILKEYIMTLSNNYSI
ncbi:MAG: hypothetical protein RR500_03160 [Bacilli bacterium]